MPENVFVNQPSFKAQSGGNIDGLLSKSGANPTIASYNASIVKFYHATGSLARFENKNIIFYF
jgi:hypothetical protein